MAVLLVLAIVGVLTQRHNAEEEKAQAAADSAKAAVIHQQEQAKQDSIAREQAKADSAAQAEAQKQLEAAAKAKWNGKYRREVEDEADYYYLTLKWNESSKSFVGKFEISEAHEGCMNTKYNVSATVAAEGKLTLSLTNGVETFTNWWQPDENGNAPETKTRKPNITGTLTCNGRSYVLSTKTYGTITLRK